jgi:hypothetical protein
MSPPSPPDGEWCLAKSERISQVPTAEDVHCVCWCRFLWQIMWNSVAGDVVCSCWSHVVVRFAKLLRWTLPWECSFAFCRLHVHVQSPLVRGGLSNCYCWNDLVRKPQIIECHCWNGRIR